MENKNGAPALMQLKKDHMLGVGAIYVALVIVVGVALSAIGAYFQQHQIDKNAKAEFERLSERTELQVISRLDTVVRALRGVRGLYMASDHRVGREEFRRFVLSRHMETEFPGVRGFGFIQRVERTDLTTFVADERADGALDFSIRQLADKSHQDLYIVKFIEPSDLNKGALGLDLGSEVLRRAGLKQAINTGAETVTGAITLVQDDKEQPGLLLYLPVYRYGTPADVPKERLAALVGVLYAPIVMAEILQGISDVQSGMLDFQIVDSPINSSGGVQLFDAGNHLTAVNSNVSSHNAARFSLRKPLQLPGRSVTLSMSSTPQFDATIDQSRPMLLLLGGSGFAVLLAILLQQQITGRRKAQSLAASMTVELDNLAQVVKKTANTVTICDASGCITWANDGFLQISGYTLEEVLGKMPGELIGTPNADPSVVKVIQSAAIAGEMCRVEILNRNKAGTEYWVDKEIQPQFDAKGALKGYMEIGTDVTAKRKMQSQLEAALRDSSALLGTLDMHAVVSMADRDGNITEVNDAFCRASGYSREELIGQNHRIVKSAFQSHAFWKQMWQSISSGQPWRGQICNQAKDGSLYWVDTFIAAFIGDDGKADKYIAIRINITEAKAVERSLALERQRLNTILDSLGEGVYTLDLNGKCNYLNTEGEQLLGWSFDELQGRPIHDIIHHHRPNGEVLPSAECPIFLAMENGQGYRSNDEMFFRKDGTSFPVAMTGSPLIFEGKKLGSVAVFTDISEAKSLQKDLQTAKVAAEEASRAKSQFLANMSHEIRTPMNAILGMLKLLVGTELNARQIDYAGKAEGAAQSLLGLLNDILDFSKIEAGKLELDPQPFSFERLLRDLSVIVSSNLGKKPVEILFDLDPTIPSQLIGDSMRLQQVLINLSGNAVKFTERGEIVVQIKVLEQTTESATLRIAVKDSGIGISPENQKRLFSDFSQAEASTTRRFGGTGLGLSICKRLVNMMGGNLCVDSVAGQGSTFHFEIQLPIAAEESARARAPTSESLQKMRVLVVDDNATARDLTAAMAMSLGWEVDVAQGGAEALNLVQIPGNEYQAIIMDWDMPGMDGWETIERVRRALNGKAAPITVMVTASGREALSERSAQEQAQLNAFLVKPITASMLHEVVSDARAGRSNLRAKDRKIQSQVKRLHGMRVLVVEDNLINQQVARELLIAEGALVEIADNGLLGVSAVTQANSETPFDVVLMDLQMPVMDGFEATRAIRMDLGLKDLPIVAMTANAMASDREACLIAGMNDHVGKPFDLNHLVSILLQVSGCRPLENETNTARRHEEIARSASTLIDNGIDVEGALARMSGMRTLYIRLVGDFVKALDGAAPEFERLLCIPALIDAGRHAHTLKGTASTLGATQLAKFASELETLCKSETDSDVLLKHSQALEEMVRSTQASLRQVLEFLQPTSEPPATTTKSSPNNVSADDLEAARSAVNELTLLLKNSDLLALQRLAELRDVLAAVEPNRLESLEDAMQGLDFEVAQKVCQEIAESLGPVVTKN